jgi:hypothetical protein
MRGSSDDSGRLVGKQEVNQWASSGSVLTSQLCSAMGNVADRWFMGRTLARIIRESEEI